MFTDTYTSNESRSNSALQVSLRARETEKKQALQMGELRVEQAAALRGTRGSFSSMVTRLLSSLHLI